MIEVSKNLFVGNEDEYKQNRYLMNEWRIIHACKEPYHREIMGYTGRAAPKQRGYHYVYDSKGDLFMNIIDGVPAQYYDFFMMREAVLCAVKAFENNKKVFVHCNQGESRAPIIAMLIMRTINKLTGSFQNSFFEFKKIYASINPSNGICEFASKNWNLFSPSAMVEIIKKRKNEPCRVNYLSAYPLFD